MALRVTPVRARSTAEKLRAAFAMADDGVALKRQQFRRRHPDATANELDRMIRAWLRRRSSDSPGRQRSTTR